MDVVAMLDMGCTNPINYYTKSIFGMALPWAMLFGSYIVYHIIRLKRGQDPMAVAYARNVAVQMGLFVTFLIYPFVSQTIFAGFNCRRLGDHEAWLSADYQISCNTVGHVVYIAIATIGVMVYPIGVPLGTVFLLVKNRHDMKVENSPGRLRYAFLVSDFKPQYYYWETVEMVRKVILTGLLMFMARGSTFQIVTAVAVMLCFLIGTARNMPYSELTSNWFKLFCETALLFTLVFSVFLKVDLNKEHMHIRVVGILMLMSNTMLPMIGIVIAVVHVAENAQLLESEDKMRFVDDGGQVDESNPSWEDFVNPMQDGASDSDEDSPLAVLASDAADGTVNNIVELFTPPPDPALSPLVARAPARGLSMVPPKKPRKDLGELVPGQKPVGRDDKPAQKLSQVGRDNVMTAPKASFEVEEKPAVTFETEEQSVQSLGQVGRNNVMTASTAAFEVEEKHAVTFETEDQPVGKDIVMAASTDAFEVEAPATFETEDKAPASSKRRTRLQDQGPGTVMASSADAFEVEEKGPATFETEDKPGQKLGQGASVMSSSADAFEVEKKAPAQKQGWRRRQTTTQTEAQAMPLDTSDAFEMAAKSPKAGARAASATTFEMEEHSKAQKSNSSKAQKPGRKKPWKKKAP
jgi:hypothetical protein